MTDVASNGGEFDLVDAGKAAGIGALTGLATTSAVLSGSAIVAIGGSFATGAGGSAATQGAIEGEVNVKEAVVAGATNLIGAGTTKVVSEGLETAVTTVTQKTVTSASGREFTRDIVETTVEKAAAGEITAATTGGVSSTARSQSACRNSDYCE